MQEDAFAASTKAANSRQVGKPSLKSISIRPLWPSWPVDCDRFLYVRVIIYHHVAHCHPNHLNQHPLGRLAQPAGLGSTSDVPTPM